MVKKNKGKSLNSKKKIFTWLWGKFEWANSTFSLKLANVLENVLGTWEMKQDFVVVNEKVTFSLAVLSSPPYFKDQAAGLTHCSFGTEWLWLYCWLLTSVLPSLHSASTSASLYPPSERFYHGTPELGIAMAVLYPVVSTKSLTWNSTSIGTSSFYWYFIWP